MLRFVSAVALLAILAACATPAPPAPSGPYGSPEEQRQRAGRTVEELDRNVGGMR